MSRDDVNTASMPGLLHEGVGVSQAQGSRLPERAALLPSVLAPWVDFVAATVSAGLAVGLLHDLGLGQWQTLAFVAPVGDAIGDAMVVVEVLVGVGPMLAETAVWMGAILSGATQFGSNIGPLAVGAWLISFGCRRAWALCELPSPVHFVCAPLIRPRQGAMGTRFASFALGLAPDRL